jgi:hypothetical protein
MFVFGMFFCLKTFHHKIKKRFYFFKKIELDLLFKNYHNWIGYFYLPNSSLIYLSKLIRTTYFFSLQK